MEIKGRAGGVKLGEVREDREKGKEEGSRGWQPAEVEKKKEEKRGWGCGEGEEKAEIEGRGGKVEDKKEEGEEKVERRRELDEEQNLKEYNGEKGCKQ